jgi:NAD(P)-dependent dehydrogenase (short-subunit alcohol dehydrogenase family)
MPKEPLSAVENQNRPTSTDANPFSVAGLVAIVTGAGANGGIGHAIALGLARAGAQLVIADNDSAGLQRTAEELTTIGGPHLAVLTDIACADDVGRLFNQVDERFGRIDLLVNVPFHFPQRLPPHELPLADWERTLTVNVSGYLLCCQAAIRRMLASNSGGSIINIGSNAGVGGLGRGALAYSCSKAAVHQLTRELAIEYAASGIRCNAILPAQTLTPGLQAHLDNPTFRAQVLPRMLAGLPQGRLLDPEDFVGPTIFLASAAARAVNGVLLPVDGGHLALSPGGSPGPDHRPGTGQ